MSLCLRAVLRIEITDKPVKGLIYIAERENQKLALCTCRDLSSEIFSGAKEEDVYFKCREWFMDHFDGFVQVSKLSGDEEEREIKRFAEIKHLF